MQSYRFNSAIILDVTGKHAQRYLNARLTNDIRLVNDTHSIEAACITPQGRTQAFFLISKSENNYKLCSTGGDANSVITAFKQFIVADQVEVIDQSQEFELWHVSDNKAAIEAQFKISLGNNFFTQDISGAKIIVRPRISDFGCDLLINKAQSALIENLKNSLISEQSFNYQRTLKNQVSFPEELNENVMFAEAGLMHAISYTKGCYAGQEVMEMLASRGTAPNKIVAIKVTGNVELKDGQEVFANAENTEKAGQILSWAQSPQSNSTVAYIKLRAKYLDNNQLYMDKNISAQIITDINL